MEARAILQKIRQRGFVIKAEGAQISLSPKLLINDKMISFIRKHKQELLTVLHQEQDSRESTHIARKRALHQGRLEVLRCLIRRYLKSGMAGHTVPTEREIEEYVDWLLSGRDFDLEDAITMYHNITPPPFITCKCRYRPPFCSCGERKPNQNTLRN